jgi:hypothetical protein
MYNHSTLISLVSLHLSSRVYNTRTITVSLNHTLRMLQIKKSSNHPLSLRRPTSSSSSTTNFPWLSPCLLVRVLLPLLFTRICSELNWQVKVKVTLLLTVRQSVNLGVEPHLGLMTRYLLLFDSFLFLWGALSDEMSGLSSVYTAGPRQLRISRVRVSWDSWPYFTVSDLRLPSSSPPTTHMITVEVFNPASTPWISIKVKVMLRPTVKSASLSWNKAPIWGLRPDLYYCQAVASLLRWGALSDERTGLSFARLSAVWTGIWIHFSYKQSAQTLRKTPIIVDVFTVSLFRNGLHNTVVVLLLGADDIENTLLYCYVT